MKTEAKYCYALTLLYFIVSLVGILHHELWVDEAHHWLLARDSDSLPELYNNTRIEGHPILWSVMLYGISRFTTNPFWMQFLHIVFSTSVVFLFLRKAPFSLLFKTLFIFGYFIIFEYNVISRNYILGVLFLFLACSAFKNRNKNFISLSLFLALAANTHLMFSVIAFALFLTLLIENYTNQQLFAKKFVSGYLVFALGLCSIVVQIYYTNSGWLLDSVNAMPFQERLTKGFVSLFKGLIAIPDFRSICFWNSNYIVNSNRTLATVLALLIYLLPLLLFFKNRKTLFFVYVGLIGTQIFFFITQRGATRFHGMTFLLIIMALWMEHYYSSEHYKFREVLHSWRLTMHKNTIVYTLLIIQLIGGVGAYAMDYRYPFTSAKQTVDFLKAQGLANKEVVTVTCDGTLLSAYLERKIWFLCDGGYQSFCHWDNACTGQVTISESTTMLYEFMKTHREVIFVSYYPLSKKLVPNIWIALNDKIKIKFLKKFNQNIVDKTNYYVFEVAPI